jgi:hypothetical protein
MNKRHQVKIVREGRFVAEVDVQVIDSEEGWSPYISMEDAYRMDDVRKALQREDVKSAAKLSRVFLLTPVAG